MSGFKSFVEPVHLKLEHNLTGVVGPNGCGKSNIIDALTWVMGESSARHLRGQALTDVIFHGGGQQAPAGRAQVELKFDNEDGRIGGEFSQYSEISIRRVLDRDGETSNYFLNGTSCRRKDIQAVFLGTGLGPRSYAVIEQGMISRLVEARPEELRAHLEEAAGVSHYREARRDTDRRIRRTRENLDRINDIRREVEGRIKVLDRQSRQAERFQALSAELERLQAQLSALEWREYEGLRAQAQESSDALDHDLETRRVRLVGLGDELKRERLELDSLDQDYETLQRESYEADAAVGRLEQSITHTEQRLGNLERELERGRSDALREQEQLSTERRTAKELDDHHAVLQVRSRELETTLQEAQGRLHQAEQAARACLRDWEQRTQEHAEVGRRREALDVRIRHLHERLQDLARRNGVCADELQAIDPSAADRELEQRQSELQQVEQRRQELEHEERRRTKILAELHAAITEVQRDLDSSRPAHQELHAALSSLQAVQRQALGRESGERMQAWLSRRGLQDCSRLGECISIQPRWRRSVELVLGIHLRSLQVPRLEASVEELEALPGGAFGVYCDDEYNAVEPWKATADFLPALYEVAGLSGLPADLLVGVYAAQDLAQALSERVHLRPGECIATPDGALVGRGWLRTVGSGAEPGILKRAGDIEALSARHNESAQRCRELEQRLGNLRAQSEQEQLTLAGLRDRLKEQHEQWSKRHSKLAVGMEKLEQRQARAMRLKEELEQIGNEQGAAMEELSTAETDRERVISSQQDIGAACARLQQAREQSETELEASRTAWQQAKDVHHAELLELEKLVSRRTSLLESAAKREEALQRLQERCRELAQEREQIEVPLPQLREERETAEQARAHRKEKLDVQQSRRKERHDAWNKRDQSRAAMETELHAAEQTRHECALKVNGYEVRRDAVAEALAESGLEASTLLAELGADVTAAEHRLRLEEVQAQLKRIGPVNLSAVGERQELEERTTYLEQQNKDLEEALQELENAMRRLDRESRRRFSETLEQVDAHLGELFKRLFGGGSARLVPDGENPMEGGLRFMAQPPGKRNTSIQLLSGGEKALSALALVFAIFRLNPAPLCVLDEVDAPLDDSNVGRYCDLVRDLSTQVQFVMITHNKLSMELADTLIGVTMQEAGVSRLVGVNVEEAVELATIDG